MRKRNVVADGAATASSHTTGVAKASVVCEDAITAANAPGLYGSIATSVLEDDETLAGHYGQRGWQ